LNAVLLIALLGADPELTGPTQFPRDTIATFCVKNPPAKGPVFWSITPKPSASQVKKRGAEIEVAFKPGRYEIGAMCWNAETNQQTELSLVTTVTEGDPPPPNPGPTPVPPGPAPTPTPVPPPPAPVPPGRYGLAAIITSGASSLTSQARAVAPQITAKFGSLISALQAGTIPQRRDFDAAFAAGAGDQAAAWTPIKNAIAAKMLALNTGGQLKSKADLLDACNEIVAGLAAVK